MADFGRGEIKQYLNDMTRAVQDRLNQRTPLSVPPRPDLIERAIQHLCDEADQDYKHFARMPEAEIDTLVADYMDNWILSSVQRFLAEGDSTSAESILPLM